MYGEVTRLHLWGVVSPGSHNNSTVPDCWHRGSSSSPLSERLQDLGLDRPVPALCSGHLPAAAHGAVPTGSYLPPCSVLQPPDRSVLEPPPQSVLLPWVQKCYMS